MGLVLSQKKTATWRRRDGERPPWGRAGTARGTRAPDRRCGRRSTHGQKPGGEAPTGEHGSGACDTLTSDVRPPDDTLLLLDVAVSVVRGDSGREEWTRSGQGTWQRCVTLLQLRGSSGGPDDNSAQREERSRPWTDRVSLHREAVRLGQ